MTKLQTVNQESKLPALFNPLDRKEEKLAQVIFGLRTEQKLTQAKLSIKAKLLIHLIEESEDYKPGFKESDYEKIFEALGYSYQAVLTTVCER